MIASKLLLPGLWLGFAIFWLVSARRVAATKRVARPGLDRARRLLAAGAFVLVLAPPGRLADALPVHGPMASALGLAITALGLGLAVWARRALGGMWSVAVALKPDHVVVTSGPYAVIRHPIYTGLLLAALGSALVNPTPAALAGLAVLTGVYVLKGVREERLLSAGLGPEYARYRERTAALAPGLRWPPRGAPVGRLRPPGRRPASGRAAPAAPASGRRSGR